VSSTDDDLLLLPTIQFLPSSRIRKAEVARLIDASVGKGGDIESHKMRAPLPTLRGAGSADPLSQPQSVSHRRAVQRTRAMQPELPHRRVSTLMASLEVPTMESTMVGLVANGGGGSNCRVPAEDVHIERRGVLRT
jgi:hypothetical protein